MATLLSILRDELDPFTVCGLLAVWCFANGFGG